MFAMSIVSIVLPLFNGIKYIEESILSVQNQSFSDWELIIVNDFGSEDGSAEVINDFMKNDSRIVLIQNNKRLGLAESLNVGIHHAKGKYIARVDVDDPSFPKRFETQVDFLEKNPDVVLCGTMQRSVLPDRSYDEIVPCDAEELKAGLLFGCEISHCSVMFRRKIFVENNWWYNPESIAEDYDLWTKIMFREKLVNIPEILVNHRWGFENISIEKGENLRQESRRISARTLRENFDINIQCDDLYLLSGWRSRPEEYAKKHRAHFIKKGYEILSEILRVNEQKNLINQEALRKILWKRWDWICKSCGIFGTDLSYDCFLKQIIEPKVSIVLPVYNAVETLRETIESILRQTYYDWELIIICEYDNIDGSTEMARAFALMDKRIKVVENSENLGLAESLNAGIRLAKGEYVARIDADDLMNAKRIEAQVGYMIKHPSVGITQLYQHYFGTGANDFIHRPPIEAEKLKAKLLFFCDVCHSTVMFRKQSFIENNLLYKNVPLEDYDLWLRVVNVTSFETIPEIYGEYRVGAGSITDEKHKSINHYMSLRIAEELKNKLGVIIPEQQLYLLCGWENAFNTMDISTKTIKLAELEAILREIYDANKKKRYYESKALLEAINHKWRWAKYGESWHDDKKNGSIDSVFEKNVEKKRNIFWRCGKRILSWGQYLNLHVHSKMIAHQSRVTMDVSDAQTAKLEKTINEKIEFWTWERYLRTEKKINIIDQKNRRIQDLLMEQRFKDNKVKYIPNEKIRIVFLFQIASFWQSWKSFYDSCCDDSRLDVKLLFLDETRTEKSQMKTAKAFLEEKQLPFLDYFEFDIDKFHPHVIVMQTPYDEWHRQNNHTSDVYKAKGYRIVYIPYGIEISDTEDSHKLHFEEDVIRNAWRIYTFSETMKKDYKRYCLNSGAVRVLGLPRFDEYCSNVKPRLPAEIENKRKGRPIVLWKVHFPKEIIENGKKCIVTPDLSEYAEFAKAIAGLKELFFILMPHPKFVDMAKTEIDKKLVHQIWDRVEASENAFVDDKDDYSISLINADYIIIDRSAVMVEAGAFGVPILYMENSDYHEPVTKAIKPLMDSYYVGHTCKDMLVFVEQCREGSDPKCIAREKAFKECIPYFDGMCGSRIKEDIISGIVNEAD